MNRLKLSARNLLSRTLCGTLICVAAAVAHAAPGPAMVLPPLTQPASGEHHVGKVIWADLVTPDLDVAKRFYGALFGWSFRDVPGDGKYALVLKDDEPLAGMFQKAPPPGAVCGSERLALGRRGQRPG